MLVMDSLLFKGEDKASTDGMTKAILELAQKLKDWSVVYHNKIEFLLCYAAAGTDLQFCALERSLGLGAVHRLGPQLNLQDKYQQVLAITTAIKLFPILLAQAEQLPKNVKLGKTKRCANGTEMFFGDTFMQKIVPLSKQPGLAGKQQLMSEVYQAVKGCNQLVQLQTGTHVSDRGDYYRVTLEPVGIELQSSTPPAGAELRAAIRCVLQALQWLHRCGYGHGDVRWENVVQLTGEAFCLIDLEAAVRLGSKPQGPEELMPRAWGHTQEALDQGVFTARSDLYMVGGLMECVPDLDLNGSQFMTRLKQKSITVEEALQHAWLQRAGSTRGGCT